MNAASQRWVTTRVIPSPAMPSEVEWFVSSIAEPPQPQPAGPALHRTVEEDLDRLVELPLGEHADAYDRIHQRLKIALADIDDA